ncbi:hypothetical protein C8Q80DRAFT_1166703 [Daedaleopsis nitida]|nr:hypothetical protein C8Q80DRAFT_1166703 [Daedaleopsis nitida]
MLAGVLHRAVSVGNILIVDESEDGSLTNLLHDFDHSKIIEDVASVKKSAGAPRRPKVSDMTPEEYNTYFERVYAAAQQEKCSVDQAGTFEFMAIKMLMNSADASTHKPAHDLDSFYWVILWVVLRHTANTLGKERCREIFEVDSDSDAATRKIAWLNHDDLQSRRHLLYVYDNAPLTNLLRDFRSLVGKHALSTAGLEYDAVLELFDDALSEEDWPDDDWVPCPSSSEAKGEDSRLHCACAPRRRHDSPLLSSCARPPPGHPALSPQRSTGEFTVARMHGAQTSKGTKRSRAEAESDDRGEPSVQTSDKAQSVPRRSTRRSDSSATSESKRRRTVVTRPAPSTHPMILRDRRARSPPKYRSK